MLACCAVKRTAASPHGTKFCGKLIHEDVRIEAVTLEGCSSACAPELCRVMTHADDSEVR